MKKLIAVLLTLAMLLGCSAFAEEAAAPDPREETRVEFITPADVALALAFVRALGEEEKHAALLETLEKQTDRVLKRRKEEKAHRKNIRQGKKKPVKS